MMGDDDRAKLLRRVDDIVGELASLRGLDSIPHARVAAIAQRLRDKLAAGGDGAAELVALEAARSAAADRR